MSLIATLIPVSLVVTSVIDKEFFDRWIIAGRVSIKTSYESKEEIVRDLKVKKLDLLTQLYDIYEKEQIKRRKGL